MMQTISLAMIVRDEEANLAECLRSIMGEVDEIIIVDTGSTDKTVKIASEFTEKIYCYEWNGDFSGARNFAISKCTSQWILSLDADEKLDAKQGSLRELINNNSNVEAFFLPLLTCSAGAYDRFMVIRLFRNMVEYHFVGKIHEQVLITKTNIVGIGEAPVILHKFITHKQRNKKRHRNLQLLKQALNNDPDNYFLKYYIGVEWLGIGQYKKALAFFQAAVDTISLGRIMFRGPAVRYLVDCLKFLGRLDEALAVCQKECKINPDYTDIFFEAGAILEEQGEFKQAVEYFHKAIELGDPPLWFYHSKGSESFLAFYHIGFCYEKNGCYQLAESYYWQALETNPQYVYPLYSLVLLKAGNLKVADVFAYFKEKGCFVHDQWGKALAMLFWQMGWPEFAAKCYEQSLTLRHDNSITRIKSLLYSGSREQGLQMINNIDGTEFTIDVVTEEILAHVLNGDYRKAKERALAYWVTAPNERSRVWAMLTIIARMSASNGYITPEKSREKAVMQAYVAILDNCLRFKEKDTGITDDGLAIKKLVKTVYDIVGQSSAEGNICLIDYFKGKAMEVRSRLHYKYPSTRGLYL